jgi:uncharacterized protein (TIGR00369 family)
MLALCDVVTLPVLRCPIGWIFQRDRVPSIHAVGERSMTEESEKTAESESLTPLPHTAQNRCFGCGEANLSGLHLKFLLAKDGTAVCLATVANTFEGPPGLLHGGIIATLLDETMSKVVRARGLTAMTRQMEIEYLRPVPSGASVRIEGRVVRSEGRKHWTEARILDAKGVVLALGKGLFVEVRAGRLTSGRPEDRPPLSAPVEL